MNKTKHASMLNDLYVVSSLIENEDESMEGRMIRFFNWDPVRLRSSWKRLGKINRKFRPSMGTKVDIKLLDEFDDYTMDLSTRGNKIVSDLSKEVLFEISLILESEEVLTKNVDLLSAAIMDGSDVRFIKLTPLPLFGRPLLGARSISGDENELDLIEQGLEIKTKTSTGFGYSQHGGVGYMVEESADRRADERNLSKAGTHWDNRKTEDVVKALRLLAPITERRSLISKSMVGANSKESKELVKQLMVWQEILYEHTYFIVHRTSKLLTETL